MQLLILLDLKKTDTRLSGMKNILYKIIRQIVGRLLRFYWKSVYAGYRAQYVISNDFRFNGAGIKLYGDGSIVLGSDSYIGELSTVQASKGYMVKIGKGSNISHNVRIYTQTSVANSDFSKKPVPSKYGDVIIGDYCWIGANVFINPGIEIGDNSVIGANSVVTRNIPPGEIWGGVPARVIRKKEIALVAGK